MCLLLKGPKAVGIFIPSPKGICSLDQLIESEQHQCLCKGVRWLGMEQGNDKQEANLLGGLPSWKGQLCWKSTPPLSLCECQHARWVQMGFI